MRLITEANAKIINESFQEQIKALIERPDNSLKTQNKIRLMRLVLRGLEKNKVSREFNKTTF